jgi:hypothetical protein
MNDDKKIPCPACRGYGYFPRHAWGIGPFGFCTRERCNVCGGKGRVSGNGIAELMQAIFAGAPSSASRTGEAGPEKDANDKVAAIASEPASAEPRPAGISLGEKYAQAIDLLIDAVEAHDQRCVEPNCLARVGLLAAIAHQLRLPEDSLKHLPRLLLEHDLHCPGCRQPRPRAGKMRVEIVIIDDPAKPET